VQLCGNFMQKSMYNLFILHYITEITTYMHYIFAAYRLEIPIKFTEVFGFKIVISKEHSYHFYHITPNLYQLWFKVLCMHISFKISAKENYLI
jgi:hypothetical protein